MFQWLTGGWGTRAAASPSTPQPTGAGRESALAKLWRWWVALDDARRMAPSRAELEALEAEAEQRRLEQAEDALVQLIVMNGGAAFPGDQAGAPRQPES